MSTIVFERISMNKSLAELTAMWMNGEIGLFEYMEMTKNPTEAPETETKTGKWYRHDLQSWVYRDENGKDTVISDPTEAPEKENAK